MKRSNRWTCDSCRQEITTIETGWVEWLVRKVDGAWIGRGLRLVHHQPYSPVNRCQYNQQAERHTDGSMLLDLPLKSFLGPDGLTRLLGMLAQGELPQQDVLEMIKRLHIPGYEQARPYFDAAIANGAFEPNTSPGYYESYDIRATLKWRAAQGI
jgi:hypothetical protein